MSKSRRKNFAATFGLLMALATFSHAEPTDEVIPPGVVPAPQGGGAGSGADVLQQAASYVNQFTGQLAFSIPLATVGNHHGIAYPVALTYSGAGLEALETTHREFAPTSWVGLGFSLAPGVIVADNKGTATPHDDDYSINVLGLSGKLIPFESDPNQFVIAGNPFVKVQRVMLGEDSSTVLDPRSEESFEFTRDFVSHWVVTLPNGAQYTIGNGNENHPNCDGPAPTPLTDPPATPNQYEVCVTAIGDKIGYNAVYNLDEYAKVAHTWYMQKIVDREGKFAVWFEYDKILESNDAIGGGIGDFWLDRAVYLKSIYATNGVLAADEKTVMVEFVRDPDVKVGKDFYDPTWKNPMAHFEKDRLDKVKVYSFNDANEAMLQMTYEFTYTASSNNTSLLADIDLVDPLFHTNRDYYTFNYNPTKQWQMDKLTGPAGVTNEFTYDDLAVETPESYAQDVDIRAKLTEWGIPEGDNPKYISSTNINGNYYLTLEHAFWKYMFEFKNRGNYWKLTRTFKASTSFAEFVVAGNGEYLVEHRYRLKIFDLTGDEEGNFDLGSETPLLDSDLPYLDDDGTVVYTFSDWIAVWNTTNANLDPSQEHHNPRSIRFFFKGSDGAWHSGSCAEFAEDPFHPLALSPPPKTGCVDFSWFEASFIYEKILVKKGNDFIGVVETRVNDGYTYNIFSIFYFDRDLEQFVENMDGLGSTNSNERQWGYDQFGQLCARDDCDNVWVRQSTGLPWIYDELMVDMTISGNLITIFKTLDIPPYQYTFQWDGNRLVFLADGEFGSSARNDMRTTHVYGSDFNWMMKDFYGEGAYFSVDQPQWSVIQHPAVTSISWETRIFPQGDYTFVESSGLEPPKYQIVVSTTDEPSDFYPHSGVDLYHQFGSEAEDVVNVTSEVAMYNGNLLGHMLFGGNRFLGVEFTGVNLTRAFVYGRLNPGTIDAENFPSFTKHPLDMPSTSSFYACALLPAGVVAVGMSDESEIDGKLRFYSELEDGSIASSGATVSVVSSVAVLTKGDASMADDGSLQTLNMFYSGEGGLVAYNSLARSPNISESSIYFPELRIHNRFRVDFPAPADNLSVADRILHGTPIETRTTPYDFDEYGKPSDPSLPLAAGDATSAVDIESVTLNEVGGQALEEPLYFSRSPGAENKEYFYTAHMTTKTWAGGFDANTGAPKSTMVRKNGEYRVSIRVPVRDLIAGASAPAHLTSQTSSYLFQTETVCPSPCANLEEAEDAFFANMNPDWLNSNYAHRGTNSQFMVHDPATWRPLKTYVWQPLVLGTDLLNAKIQNEGELDSRWLQVSEVLAWKDGVAVARVRNNKPIEAKGIDTRSAMYYAGLRCDLIGSVTNAGLYNSAILTGEESVSASTAAGAYGRWVIQTGTVLSDEIVHSGGKSFKVTQSPGPEIDLKLAQQPDFIDRQKGYLVSAWIYARPGSIPEFDVTFYDEGAVPTGQVISILEKYEETNGPLPRDRWVKLEWVIPYSELVSTAFEDGNVADDFIKVNIGVASGSPATAAVYVDDVRCHPVDATAAVRNYDGRGRVISVLDQNNELLFMEYDTWGRQIAVRDAKGLVYRSTAYRNVGE